MTLQFLFTTLLLFLPALSPGCFSRQKDLALTSSGEKAIGIRDIAVLSPSRILVTDYTNKTLRLLDSVNGGVVSQVKLPGSPCGVCLLEDGRAVVALYDMKQLQFCRIVGDSLSLDESIQVNDSVWGVSACGSSHLLVSYCSPGGVKKMTMDGRVIDEVDNQKTGKQLFQKPCNIAMLNSGDVFVSDVGTCTIIQMDRNLRITKTFTSPMIKKPWGNVSVSTDQLLVAGRDSDSIIVLNPTSGLVTPLLGKTDGIQQPFAMAWCPASKKLFVGRDGTETTLSVFTV